MQRYDSYKDSGVKWLGEIPSHWEVCKVKNLCVEIFSGGTPSSGETKYWDGNIPWIPSGMCHDCDIECAPKYITELGYRNSSTRFIPSGTTVMAMTGATCSMVGFLKFESCANQSVTAFVSHKRLLKSRYLFFLLQAMRKYILTFQTGGAQGGINVNDCKNLIIPRIPAEEQEAIANYLDAATSKIDEAISQQQKMIDLLNERKQIIINNAVTKGLDPNVKMKPSGIDWIGDIPEHWEVLRLASIGTFSKGGNVSRDDLKDHGKNVILYGDIYTKYNYFTSEVKNHISNDTAKNSVRIQNGDILMTGSGETKEDIGKTIVFMGDEAYIGGDVILFKQSNNDSIYLSYVLNSQYAKDYRYRESKGEIIVHIYASSLKGLFIAMPPSKEEQVRISEFLSDRIKILDSEINLIGKQISLLQERKQIIINDVVTGKVKVI